MKFAPVVLAARAAGANWLFPRRRRRISASGNGCPRISTTAACRPTASGWPTVSPARTATTSCESSISPTARTKTIAFGAQPAFSADSRWAAVAIGVSEAQQEKMRKEKKPVHRKLALLNLATGDLATIDSVESYAFSPDGHEILMRHYAPERPGRPEPDPAAALDPEDTPGATAVVRDLASGRDTTFGNVGDAAWETKGKLLAIAIEAEDRRRQRRPGVRPRVGHAARPRLRLVALSRRHVAEGCRRPRRAEIEG